MSTRREIADDVARNFARRFVVTALAELNLADAVDKVLRDRDERTAQIIDVRIAEINNYQTRPYRVARRELEVAAEKIRKDD